MSGEEVIELRNVRKTFSTSKGRATAVDNISFGVRKGEILGVLGPNGAGKTTTLRMIVTILTPDSGSIRVDGYEVTENPLAVRSRIAYMQQEPELTPFFTVEEEIRYYLLFRGMSKKESRERCEEALRDFGLENHRHKESFQLSTGLKRRVQIASVLSADAPITFLDEPTTGLDPESRRDTWRYIKTMFSKSKEHTLVLTTHDLHEAEHLSDRVIILNEGKIVEEGSPEDLKGRFGKVVQITFEEDGPLTRSLRQSLLALDGVDEVVQTAKNTIQLQVDSLHQSITEIVETIGRAGLRIEDIDTKVTQFEDIYLDILNRTRETEDKAEGAQL